MANRGLSDNEIGIVKAMILAGIPAQDICGYMFRPDRSLNPAGVYEIKAGKRGAAIPPHTPEQLQEWLTNHPYFGSIATADLVSDLRKELRGLLRPLKDGEVLRVDPKETSIVEFKETFHPKSFAEYCRSLIGYANHRGGFIVFGITDDRRIVGLKGQGFRSFDPKKGSELAKVLVTPSLRWVSFSMLLLNMEVGVFYAEEAELKPLVTIKNADKIKENTVYFRYEAETAVIRAGDLHSIIREREQQAVQSAISKLQQITGIGLENAAVVDTRTSEIQTQHDGSIHQPDLEELPARIVVRKAGISDLDVLTDFINEVQTLDPVAYLVQSAHEAVRWLPLFYYSSMSGLTPAAIIVELSRSPVSKPGTIQHMRRRLLGQISALKENIGGKPAALLAKLKSGEIPDIKDRAAARHFAMCLMAAKPEDNLAPSVMRLALRRIVELYVRYNKDSAIGSSMRRSAARVDELLYRPA